MHHFLYICVSFQQPFTEKSSCQLTIVISTAMSTDYDRGLEISETLNLQPKVRSRKDEITLGVEQKGEKFRF